MAQWTNDRWTSTLHRVVNPERSLAGQPRMSIVFFQQPNEDAVISCLPTCMDADHPAKYEPVSAGAPCGRENARGLDGKGREARGGHDGYILKIRIVACPCIQSPYSVTTVTARPARLL